MPKFRAALVTSEVTFVPENYSLLVDELLAHDAVVALIVLKNSDFKLSLKALGSMVLGAKQVGRQLLLNQLAALRSRRRKRTEALSKKYLELPDVKSPHSLETFRELDLDLIINARTRFIYPKSLLEIPRLGCVNIHHGLLPDQRGTMCDLWALQAKVDSGFTVHWMNPKIDDGNIIEAHVVSKADENRKDYLDHIRRASMDEAKILKVLLDQMVEGRIPDGFPNLQAERRAHFKNPTPSEIKIMRAEGICL
ncbi:hypothetical protein GW915_03390 [bacterium]|nr:hypothetical protein [bacterium]